MGRPLLFAVLFATACGSTPGTRARLISPPDGQVRVIETPSGNQRVDVTLRRVPAPQRYDPASSVFVVWIIPPDGPAIRAGELAHDPRSGEGVGSVYTPRYDRFQVLVTAEPANMETMEPGPGVVMAEEIVSDELAA